MSQSNPEIGKRVLERLNELGCDTSSESSIKKWLRRQKFKDKARPEFERTISQWKTSEPGLSTLKVLGDVTGKSLRVLLGDLDWLVGHASVEHEAEQLDHAAGQRWLREFFGRTESLSCYATWIPRVDFDAWKKSAKPIRDIERASHSEVRMAVETAREWAKKIKVAAMSLGLARQANEPVSPQDLTMESMIDTRLKWTEQVEGVDPQLIEVARWDAYWGIYQVVSAGRAFDSKRYPAVEPPKRESSDHGPRPPVVTRSIKVKSDPLPAPDGDHGFIVYYDWGRAIEDNEWKSHLSTKLNPDWKG